MSLEDTGDKDERFIAVACALLTIRARRQCFPFNTIDRRILVAVVSNKPRAI